MPYNTGFWKLIDNYWLYNAGFWKLIDNYWLYNARFGKLINEYLLFFSDNILLKSRFSINKAIDNDYRRRASGIKFHKTYRNP